MYLISLLIEIWALKYRFPMKAPRTATTIPGKNTGVKRMMAASLVYILTKAFVALMTECAEGPYILRIS